jgi:peptide deformylase
MSNRLSIVIINKPTLWLKNISLRQKCMPIDINNPEELAQAQIIIQEMFRVLYADPSSVALAASQVGILLQITVIDFVDREKNERKLLALINPKITRYSEETIEGQEICLSVPNFTGKVKRSKEIEVEAFNPMGELIKISASDYFATVLQHEIDHLNGIIYIDKIIGDLEGVPDYPERNMRHTTKEIGLKLSQ